MDLNLTLTEFAASKVKEIRAAENIPDDQLLRIGVRGGGCSGFMFDLGFDPKQPNDIQLTIHDTTIVIDPMSAMYLDGITIDYVQGLMGSGFKFDGGAIKASCGCGKSVSF
jgi:iron-sulfur cluster assembly accessory protein